MLIFPGMDIECGLVFRNSNNCILSSASHEVPIHLHPTPLMIPHVCTGLYCIISDMLQERTAVSHRIWREHSCRREYHSCMQLHIRDLTAPFWMPLLSNPCDRQIRYYCVEQITSFKKPDLVISNCGRNTVVFPGKDTHVRTFPICLNMKNGYYHFFVGQNLKFYILKSIIIFISISMSCMYDFNASV